MKGKIRKVVGSAVRSSIIGTNSYWVLRLECGHSAERLRSKQSWRARQKPCPKTVACRECSRELMDCESESRDSQLCDNGGDS